MSCILYFASIQGGYLFEISWTVSISLVMIKFENHFEKVLCETLAHTGILLTQMFLLGSNSCNCFLGYFLRTKFHGQSQRTLLGINSMYSKSSFADVHSRNLGTLYFHRHNLSRSHLEISQGYWRLKVLSNTVFSAILLNIYATILLLSGKLIYTVYTDFSGWSLNYRRKSATVLISEPWYVSFCRNLTASMSISLLYPIVRIFYSHILKSHESVVFRFHCVNTRFLQFSWKSLLWIWHLKISFT